MLRNSTMRKTWKFWALCLAATSVVTVSADSNKSVTAAQVNGTWKTKYGEFKIWALATIEGDTAIFKPEGAEEECRITLKFTGGKLVVAQTGICGFGHNVSAAGTYKKVSAKKPKFESN
jgi:hypothetical protein